jgi:hypothetical protein
MKRRMWKKGENWNEKEERGNKKGKLLKGMGDKVLSSGVEPCHFAWFRL